jgi:hypothetical protein
VAPTRRGEERETPAAGLQHGFQGTAKQEERHLSELRRDELHQQSRASVASHDAVSHDPIVVEHRQGPVGVRYQGRCWMFNSLRSVPWRTRFVSKLG